MSAIQPRKLASGHCVLPEISQERLRTFLREVGDDVAARRIGMHRLTLTRAAIGLEITIGSATVILTALQSVA